MTIKTLITKCRFTLVIFLFITCFHSYAYAEPLLNGVSIHNELGKEQFIGGIYSTTLSRNATTIIAGQERKRIQVRVLVDNLSSRRFRRMWIEGMAINSAPAELEQHAKHLADFSNMLKVKLLNGDIFSIERTEDEALVYLNGIKLGSIPDPKFFDLLLRVWIGPVPLSSEFREQLLVGGAIDPKLLKRFNSTQPTQERISALENAVEERQNSDENNKDNEAANALATAATAGLATKPNLVIPSIAVPTLPKAEQAKKEEPSAAAQATDAKTTTDNAKEPTPQVATQTAKPSAETPVASNIFDDAEEEESFTAESVLEEQRYYTTLAKYTHQFLKYPQRSWDRGHEGNIRLRVTVDRKGKVKDTEILEEAKYKALNKEALNAVKRADPYPKMPENVTGKDYSFTFRVIFKVSANK